MFKALNMNKVALASRGVALTSNQMFDTLDDIRDDIATRLIQAGKDRRSPMHTPVVGTSDANLRVMVLREFDGEQWGLRFHTDARAPKCTAVREGGAVGVLFYDPGAKTQIRARGNGKALTQGAQVDAAWKQSSNYARRCYLAEGAPGRAADGPTSGLPQWAEGIQPDDAQVAPARENFAILTVELTSLDWLYLAHDGHRRARFRRDGAEWRGGFVIP